MKLIIRNEFVENFLAGSEFPSRVRVAKVCQEVNKFSRFPQKRLIFSNPVATRTVVHRYFAYSSDNVPR